MEKLVKALKENTILEFFKYECVNPLEFTPEVLATWFLLTYDAFFRKVEQQPVYYNRYFVTGRKEENLIKAGYYFIDKNYNTSTRVINFGKELGIPDSHPLMSFALSYIKNLEQIHKLKMSMPGIKDLKEKCALKNCKESVAYFLYKNVYPYIGDIDGTLKIDVDSVGEHIYKAIGHIRMTARQSNQTSTTKKSVKDSDIEETSKSLIEDFYSEGKIGSLVFTSSKISDEPIKPIVQENTDNEEEELNPIESMLELTKKKALEKNNTIGTIPKLKRRIVTDKEWDEYMNTSSVVPNETIHALTIAGEKVINSSEDFNKTILDIVEVATRRDDYIKSLDINKNKDNEFLNAINDAVPLELNNENGFCNEKGSLENGIKVLDYIVRHSLFRRLTPIEMGKEVNFLTCGPVEYLRFRTFHHSCPLNMLNYDNMVSALHSPQALFEIDNFQNLKTVEARDKLFNDIAIRYMETRISFWKTNVTGDAKSQEMDVIKGINANNALLHELVTTIKGLSGLDKLAKNMRSLEESLISAGRVSVQQIKDPIPITSLPGFKSTEPIATTSTSQQQSSHQQRLISALKTLSSGKGGGI